MLFFVIGQDLKTRYNKLRAFRKEMRKIWTHLEFQGKKLFFSDTFFQGTQPPSRIEGSYKIKTLSRVFIF